MYICIYAGGAASELGVAASEQATLGVYICIYVYICRRSSKRANYSRRIYMCICIYVYMQAEQQESKLLSAYIYVCIYICRRSSKRASSSRRSSKQQATRLLAASCSRARRSSKSSGAARRGSKLLARYSTTDVILLSHTYTAYS